MSDNLYSEVLPRRPTKLHAGVRDLKEKLKTFVKENVRLLVELPSIEVTKSKNTKKEITKNSNTEKEATNNKNISDSPYISGTQTPSALQKARPVHEVCRDIENTLTETSDLLQVGHQLSRKKAAEVMVWVLANKDRLWSAEVPNSAPIAYGLKNFKFTSFQFREACDYVLKSCEEAGIKVPLLAFDGQWYTVMVRDINGKPLTRLQLQKDVWAEVCSMPKRDIVNASKETNVIQLDSEHGNESGICIEKVNGRIVVSSTSRAFDCFKTYPESKGQPKAPVDISEESSERHDVLSWIPDEVMHLIEKKGDTALRKTLNSIVKELEHKNSNCDTVAENEEEHVDIEERRESVELTTEDSENIVKRLSSVSKCAPVNVTPDMIKENVSNAETIKKIFTIPQLDVIAEIIKKDKLPTFVYKKSWNKPDKINALSQILGDKSKISVGEKKRNEKVLSLKQLSAKVVKNQVKRASLCLWYARWILPETMKDLEDLFPRPSSVEIDGGTIDMQWYSIPEKNPSTGELLCKCKDSHHLLTNLRTKTSTTGLQNVSSDAWKRVARSYETKLTPSMVEDLVNKQSNANAQTHFSEEVENKMIENGDTKEAAFCRIIRDWYNAEDAPGISVKERIEKLMNVRRFLLQNIDFAKFPPPTQYIKGLSLVAFEGFLTGIDTKLQLYHLCGGSYCVRTASSLPAETCVGGIQDLNFSNSVAVKAKDVPNIMASLSEIMTLKSDPDRIFFFKTSRTSVYPVIQRSTDRDMADDMLTVEKSAIVPRDHSFDLGSRRRTKPHRKPGTVNMNLDAAPRGAQPLRREFFQTNEAKIDALKKSGYNIKNSD